MRAGEESSGSRVKGNKGQKPDSAEKKKENERATYHRRGVGARVWLHAKLLVPREAAVRDEVHRVRNLRVRKIFGARPTEVPVAAHLTDQMRPALERQNSARHEGGQQVGPSQAG